MSDKLTKTEQDLMDIKGCIERVFTSEDGKSLMAFMESLSGYNEFIPLNNLQTGEGARRLVIFLKKANSLKQDRFLFWCKEVGHKFLTS